MQFLELRTHEEKLIWYTLSHYSFGRLVVHDMNADYPVRRFLWFSTTKAKCRDIPLFFTDLKLKSSPENDAKT